MILLYRSVHEESENSTEPEPSVPSHIPPSADAQVQPVSACLHDTPSTSSPSLLSHKPATPLTPDQPSCDSQQHVHSFTSEYQGTASNSSAIIRSMHSLTQISQAKRLNSLKKSSERRNTSVHSSHHGLPIINGCTTTKTPIGRTVLFVSTPSKIML